MSKRRSRKNPVPLIKEDHPDNYDGYPFITLIQYQHNSLLTIIDDTDSKTVGAYVLDLCGPEQIEEQSLILIATDWFATNADRFPLSFEFSRQGLTSVVSSVYRTYNIDYITRVIGPFPSFNMDTPPTIRRRRKKPLPNGITVGKRVL